MTSTGSIGSTSVEEKSVEARYGNDIISVGVSPSIGYHVTPRLALAAGVALYRNLDQSLTLKNEESIDRATLSNNVISSSQQIGKWDAGITGNASYNVSRKLAVDVQYRYGLSTYMRQDDKAVRNSGVGLGLNYMFGER
jgi:opacity protein-like surface antigen